MAGKNIFNSVKMTRENRNLFDLSHDVKLSMNMGELVPIMCTECVPGDKFNISCESLIRFAPMVAPIMHRVDVTMHYFFVPNRIVWPNWEKYATNTPLNDVTPDLPAFPTIGIDNLSYTRLCDYFGLPNPGTTGGTISAIPFAAYAKIYNEYYRDQNLIDPIIDTLVDGDNNANQASLFAMRRRAWEHDYFTAALPFAQKGQAVDLPIGAIGSDTPVYLNSGTPGTTNITATNPTEVRNALSLDPDVNPNELYAATTGEEVEATTINDLRIAMRLQEWLEKAARGGSRYIENIKVMFGISSSDKRLQRPEYITGVKSPVKISEVLNTTGTDDSPQGNMAGHGVSVVSGQYGNYFCEEHGYIIGIMSVMPKTAYQNGYPKHFLKVNDPFELYWPSFAHLGEQPVMNIEVHAEHTDYDGVFGYVPRYAEYKFEQNRVAGDFRNTLDFWHMGRQLTNSVALNGDFVTCDPTHRIFAVTDPGQQKLWCHVYNKISASRLMPKFGTPTF